MNFDLGIFRQFCYGILGLVAGSFAGCVSYRCLHGCSILRPARSFCPECGIILAWYDNIPLVSYLFLRGKCRHCGQRITSRYPLIEAAMLFFSVALGWSGVGWFEVVGMLTMFFFLVGICHELENGSVPLWCLSGVLFFVMVGAFVGKMSYFNLAMGIGIGVILAELVCWRGARERVCQFPMLKYLLLIVVLVSCVFSCWVLTGCVVGVTLSLGRKCGSRSTLPYFAVGCSGVFFGMLFG